MVGIVIVSHSWKIAEGVRDLALEMAAGHNGIIAAGGLDDENKSIGTDAEKIMRAIIAANQAGGNDGVVILADIGSGIMSSETAIELLAESDDENSPSGVEDDEKSPSGVEDDNYRNIKVKIADAPIVEGAICAAVEAAGGSDLEAVIAAAEEARGESKL